MSNLKLLLMAVTLFCGGTLQAENSSEVLSMIHKVNDYWQAKNSPYKRAFWDNAAYYTGNMEAYRMTGKAEWYQYSDRWCRHNEWKGAKSNDRSKWK